MNRIDESYLEITRKDDNNITIKKKSQIPGDFPEILSNNIDLNPAELNPKSPSSSKFSVRAENINIADTVVGLPHQTSRNSQSEVSEKKLTPKVKKRRGKLRGKELDLTSTKPITCFFRKEDTVLHKGLNGESKTEK